MSASGGIVSGSGNRRAGTLGRVDAFISYAREERTFVSDELRPGLVAAEKVVWVDLDDIPPAADWRSLVDRGIDAAAAFIFVISPDSLRSAICQEELRRAVASHKRLVPILRRDLDGDAVPTDI